MGRLHRYARTGNYDAVAECLVEGDDVNHIGVYLEPVERRTRCTLSTPRSGCTLGCSVWAISSRLSTRRGPGRLK